MPNCHNWPSNTRALSDQLHKRKQLISNGWNSVLIQNIKKLFSHRPKLSSISSICMEVFTACQFIISQSRKFLKNYLYSPVLLCYQWISLSSLDLCKFPSNPKKKLFKNITTEQWHLQVIKKLFILYSFALLKAPETILKFLILKQTHFHHVKNHETCYLRAISPISCSVHQVACWYDILSFAWMGNNTF